MCAVLRLVLEAAAVRHAASSLFFCFSRLDPSVLLAWKLSCVTIKSLVSSGVPIMAFSSIGLLLMGMSYYRDGARTENLGGQVKVS